MLLLMGDLNLYENLKTRFRQIYGEEGEEIRLFFAPGRVSLLGEFSDSNGGHALSCATGLGIAAAVRRRDGVSIRIASLKDEASGVREIPLDGEIEIREEDGWLKYPGAMLRVMRKRSEEPWSGLDILFSGTIPTEAGLSSSSAAEVLTGYIVREMNGLTGISRMDLAALAKEANTEVLGLESGMMDSLAAALGRGDTAIMYSAARMKVDWVPFRLSGLKIVITDSREVPENGKMAFESREKECARALKKLQSVAHITQLCNLPPDRFESCKDVIMNDVCTRRARHVIYEDARTVRAYSALLVGNIKRLGELMNLSQKSLRDDYEVTTPGIDFLVSEAQKFPGVLGSRMIGRGFGGCTVSIVPGEAVEEFTGTIREAYRAETGLEAAFYVTDAADGVHEIRE